MTSRFPKDFWNDRRVSTAELPLDELNLTASQQSVSSRMSRPARDGRCSASSDRSMPTSHDRQAVYVPENYEPNYAYPLIIWLHGQGSSERELLRLMPAISTQNYFGISFRGTSPAKQVFPPMYGWSRSDEAFADFEHELHQAVCQLRREYHIHSERIFLAGFDDGATMALELVFNRPEWFAGVIALGGQFPKRRNPLVRFCDLQGKRVLIAGSRGGKVAVVDVVHAGRLLHTAGMNVSTRIFEAGHEVTPEMLQHVNRWLMQAICEANCV